MHQHNQAVLNVLESLGIKDKPIFTVLNKIDLVHDRSWLEVSAKEFSDAIFISAFTGENINALIKKLEKYFSGLMLNLKILIPHARMQLVDFFYRQAKVNKIDYLQEGVQIDLSIPRQIYDKISQDKDIKNIC
jgi:GTP-binding protein HflX